MPFRSHLGRDIDVRHVPNVLIIAITLLAGGVAVLMWLSDGPAEAIFFAPAYAFVTWGLLREVDPDHNWTALVSAVVAATWILTGGAHISVLALGVLMVVGRIVTESTGRRPLMTDLVALLIAGLAAYRVEGWVAAFGLAIALYLDVRFAESPRPAQIWVSAGIAAGATLMATLTDAFPDTVPGIDPVIAIVAGTLALALVVREPAEPISQVDARHKSFMSQDRLHASRSLLGVLVFAISLLTGDNAEGLVPTLAALLLVVISNEVELARRRRL
jgi:hypothetical protein